MNDVIKLFYQNNNLIQEQWNRVCFASKKEGLSFQYCTIKKLPDNLDLIGSIYISHTKITELPKGLKTQHTLSIMNTGIEELPEDLYVRLNIAVDDDKIRYFKKKYPHLSYKII